MGREERCVFGTYFVEHQHTEEGTPVCVLETGVGVRLIYLHENVPYSPAENITIALLHNSSVPC